MGVFDSTTKTAMQAFWNNQTALIERKVESGVSPTGEPLSGVQTVYASVPCQIESNKNGDLQVTVAGVTYMASHQCSIDGLPASQVSGYNPGDSVTVNGISYIVATLGRGAFVDVQPNDRITDGTGATYLVVAIAVLTDVLPHTLLTLQKGKAW